MDKVIGILIKNKTIIVCDGCKKTINGKYLSIKPDGTILKFDYCNSDCRDTHHEENLKKVIDELQQLTQMHQERVTQKNALEGAIAGLREFGSAPKEQVQDKSAE